MTEIKNKQMPIVLNIKFRHHNNIMYSMNNRYSVSTLLVFLNIKFKKLLYLFSRADKHTQLNI